MKLAKDIMNPAPPVIGFDKSIEEAITHFQNLKTGFAAVSASQDRFHGVLTEAVLMKIYLRYQANPEKKVLILYRDLFEPVQLVQESEPFQEVIKKIGTAIGHRIFVINSQGAVVGYITAKDVLSVFVGGTDKTKSQPSTVDSQLYLYETFFTKSPFMMHSANSQGQIQMANEMLHAVLGYEYGQLIGKTIYDLYSKEQHKKAEKGLQTVMDTGYHKVIQTKMLHRQGQEISVELVSRALLDHSGRSIGTVTVSRPQDMQYLLEVLPELN